MGFFLEIYNDSIDLDLSDVKHINSWHYLPLIDAHIVPDLSSRSPSSWWLGPLSTAPVFIEHTLAF